MVIPLPPPPPSGCNPHPGAGSVFPYILANNAKLAAKSCLAWSFSVCAYYTTASVAGGTCHYPLRQTHCDPYRRSGSPLLSHHYTSLPVAFRMIGTDQQILICGYGFTAHLSMIHTVVSRRYRSFSAAGIHEIVLIATPTAVGCPWSGLF